MERLHLRMAWRALHREGRRRDAMGVRSLGTTSRWLWLGAGALGLIGLGRPRASALDALKHMQFKELPKAALDDAPTMPDRLWPGIEVPAMAVAGISRQMARRFMARPVASLLLTVQ